MSNRVVRILAVVIVSMPVFACCLGSRKWLPSDVQWSIISADALVMTDFARTDVPTVSDCSAWSEAGVGPIEIASPSYLAGRWGQDSRPPRTLEVVGHPEWILSGTRESHGCAHGCPTRFTFFALDLPPGQYTLRGEDGEEFAVHVSESGAAFSSVDWAQSEGNEGTTCGPNGAVCAEDEICVDGMGCGELCYTGEDCVSDVHGWCESEFFPRPSGIMQYEALVQLPSPDRCRDDSDCPSDWACRPWDEEGSACVPPGSCGYGALP